MIHKECIYQYIRTYVLHLSTFVYALIEPISTIGL